MTKTKSRSSILNAFQQSKAISWVNPNPSPLPNRSDSVLTRNYAPAGRCGMCLMQIEALQPGGLDPRHVETKVPYGKCG
jgi:hypothetical protein